MHTLWSQPCDLLSRDGAQLLTSILCSRIALVNLHRPPRDIRSTTSRSQSNSNSDRKPVAQFTANDWPIVSDRVFKWLARGPVLSVSIFVVLLAAFEFVVFWLARFQAGGRMTEWNVRVEKWIPRERMQPRRMVFGWPRDSPRDRWTRQREWRRIGVEREIDGTAERRRLTDANSWTWTASRYLQDRPHDVPPVFYRIRPRRMFSCHTRMHAGRTHKVREVRGEANSWVPTP